MTMVIDLSGVPQLLPVPDYSPDKNQGYPKFITRMDNEKDLFPFQQEDVNYLATLLANGKQVALNFNEMGLGKTREAIAVANSLQKSRILIICPKSLLLNWRKEIEMLDGNRVMIAKPTTYKKFQDFLEHFYTTRWFAINVDVLRRPEFNDFMFLMGFDFVIFDEAHHMRNMDKAAKARGARDFFRKFLKKPTSFQGEIRAKHALFLTGSPVVNEATDMYAYFQFVDEERFPGYKHFKYNYCKIITGYKSDKAKGFLNPQQIKDIISENGVQHLKKEVMSELPEKIVNIIPLEMDDDQRQIYNDVEEEFIVLLDSGEPLHAPGVLAKLIRLRQLSTDPALVGLSTVSSIKTHFFGEFVDELGDIPLVVYSAFETYITELCKVLDKKKKSYVRLTGKEDGLTRGRNVEKFQRGDVQFSMGTIQAGGEGITLTRASNVMLTDRWWTPAANSQAVDRLHRIGQKSNVTIHVLQCLDSIDQYMDIVLQEKQSMIESVIVEGDVQREVMERMKAAIKARNKYPR